MTRKKLFPYTLSVVVGLMSVWLWETTVRADQLVTTEFQVTTTPSAFVESIPRLGEDATGRYVVYTQTGSGPTNILMQRIDDTGIIGAPILIASDGVLEEDLPDADGDYIVYTAFEELV